MKTAPNAHQIKFLNSGCAAIAQSTKGRARTFKDKKRIAKNAWHRED